MVEAQKAQLEQALLNLELEKGKRELLNGNGRFCKKT